MAVTARLSFLAVFLGAVAYFVPLDRGPSAAELLVFFFAGALSYELLLHRLLKKIAVWPNDRRNAERLISTFDKNLIGEVRGAEFGWLSDPTVDALRKVAFPELGEDRFVDYSMHQSYRYLREQVELFLEIVDSEMFRGAVPGRVEIPIEWKGERPDHDLHKRYRKTQRNLILQARRVEEAVKLFANCFEGASHRL